MAWLYINAEEFVNLDHFSRIVVRNSLGDPLYQNYTGDVRWMVVAEGPQESRVLFYEDSRQAALDRMRSLADDVLKS